MATSRSNSKRALTIVAHHALNPEERGETRPARDGPYMMETGGWIEDQVAGGQLDVVRSVGILHHQFAAIVLIRGRQEQRGRKVGPNSVGRPRNRADGIVHMRSERLTAMRSG